MGLPEILIIALMLAFNGAFAAFELALASVRPAQLQLALQTGRRGARAALAMRGRMEGSLAVVQLGITLAGFVAAATGGAGSEEGLSPWIEQRFGLSEAWAEVIALTVFVLPLAALTIVVGELVPKLLALRDPLSVCLRLSPAMNVFAWIVHPAVVFFAWAAAFVVRRLSGGDTSPAAPGIAELRAQIQLLGVARQIGPEEERLLLAASHFSRVPVANVLVPVDAMVTLSLEASVEECFSTAMADLHTRFPVTRTRGDLGDILGYVSFKELALLAHDAQGATSLAPIVRPIASLVSTTLLGDAMQLLVAQHMHIVVVRDPEGRLLGMMTLEDLFEELVGEIEDEFDALPTHVEKRGAELVVGGGARIDRLRAELACPTFGGEAGPGTTLDAWLRGLRKRRWRGGEQLEQGAFTLTIGRVRRRKILESTIRPRGAGPA